MRSLVATLCAGLLLLAGCDNLSIFGSKPPPTPSTTTPAPPTDAPDTETPTDAPTSDAPPPPPAGTIVIAPGRVGALMVGMTADEALKGGLVREPEEGDCGLTATGAYKGFNVQFADVDGHDELFGVLVKDPGPKTAKGIGVGDSIAQLKQAYGDRLKAKTGDFGEQVYVLTKGENAIGFTEGSAEDAGKVFAIDVFKANTPVLWDGC